jgi:signal transduction histidine kinase
MKDERFLHPPRPVSDPTEGGAPAAARYPHCVDSCVLIRLGFAAKDRDELADLAGRPETRGEVEAAIARRALADRLSSAAALAAGVAHELNNPLAYVTANLAFLAERTARLAEVLAGAPRTADDVDLGTQLAEAMREARTGAERMRAVVRDLKTFARVDEEQPKPVDVRPIIDSCLNVAWTEIRRRAGLVRDLEAVPPVLGDEGRLSQVFLNLLLNAAQSIPAGRPDGHEVRVATRTRADGRVEVEVRDNGGGITPEHLPRIFDPFFTTKGPRHGTGLGLSICYSVISGMGGEIEVESTVGAGSTFRVLLAPAPHEAARHAGFPAPPGPRQG